MGLNQFIEVETKTGNIKKLKSSEVSKIFKQIEHTSKTNDKIKILHDHKNNRVLKELLYYCYNTFINFYIKKIPKIKKTGYLQIDEEIESFKKLLEILSSRKVTGNAAIDLLTAYMLDFTQESQDIITKIIKRDVKVGISAKTVNKVWDKLIPIFSVALANKYDANKFDILDGNWFASRKLDGCRNITIIKDGDIKFYTRKGTPFLTLDNLKTEIKKLKLNNMVLDGELCIVKNGIEDFSAIMKEWNRKNHTIKNPKYYIFDILTIDEFNNRISERDFGTRYKELKKIKNTDMLEVLNQEIITENTFSTLQDGVVKNGWEGLIVRKNTIYQGKRSNDLLKVKKFFDAEFIIKDIELGEMTFTDKGKGQVTEQTLTNVVIEYKGEKVDVGSGFSKEQRRYYYKNPKELLGKEITVQWFEESVNKNGKVSLRFPTLKAIWKNKRSV